MDQDALKPSSSMHQDDNSALKLENECLLSEMVTLVEQIQELRLENQQHSKKMLQLKMQLRHHEVALDSLYRYVMGMAGPHFPTAASPNPNPLGNWTMQRHGPMPCSTNTSPSLPASGATTFVESWACQMCAPLWLQQPLPAATTTPHLQARWATPAVVVVGVSDVPTKALGRMS